MRKFLLQFRALIVLGLEAQRAPPLEIGFGAPAHFPVRIAEVLVLGASGAGEGSGSARFAVVGTRPSGRTGEDATSLVFGVHDEAGALLDVLKVFVERGIPLVNIQRHRAEDGPRSPFFYVEMAGHFTDRALVITFEELKRTTRFFKVLGSYPVSPAT